MTSVYYFCTVCTYITYYKIIVINANMYYIHYRKHCFDVQIRYHLSKSKISKQILTVGLFQTLIVSSIYTKQIIHIEPNCPPPYHVSSWLHFVFLKYQNSTRLIPFTDHQFPLYLCLQSYRTQDYDKSFWDDSQVFIQLFY